jgi:RimJ/RimL family protein N-acetyltransferase
MQLATSRLILRDFVDEDWRRTQQYRSDERYRRYYPEEKTSEDSTREFVRMVMGWAAEEPRQKFQLAITRASDGLLVGNCGVRITSARDREAEFGCELDPGEWGNGFATEASCAIIGYGFRALGMHRIWARIISENSAAVKLAERMGMQLEGRVPKNLFFKARWWDDVVYAILEQDWLKGLASRAGLDRRGR